MHTNETVLPDTTTNFVQSRYDHPAILFGLGREGWSTYQFLRKYLPHLPILMIDDQPLELLASHWQEAVKQPGTSFLQSAIVQQDMLPKKGTVYKTPGIPHSHQLFSLLGTAEYQQSSNLQVLLEVITHLNTQTTTGKHITTIGVTGTKGKSTTATLIQSVLSQSQYFPILGGNIGRSPLDLLDEIEKNPTEKQLAVVLELSSHQLADITVSPHIAIIQNISPEHLDYYATFWEYVAAKARIVRFQSASDTVITCSEFSIPSSLAYMSKSTHTTYQVSESFSPESSRNIIVPEELQDQLQQHKNHTFLAPIPRVFCKDQQIWIDGKSVWNSTALQSELHLLGTHNLYNLLAAITVGVVLTIAPKHIYAGLASFKPLDHRLQLIAEINGIKYVNDSLATTPEASVAAIESFTNSRIILLAGGHDRHLDFTPLIDALHKYQVKALILFPPTGEHISAALHRKYPGSILNESQFKVHTMTEAVHIANKLAKPGDIVLLSPASASFGTFKDYQDRGEQFGAAVQLLEQTHSG